MEQGAPCKTLLLLIDEYYPKVRRRALQTGTLLAASKSSGASGEQVGVWPGRANACFSHRSVLGLDLQQHRVAAVALSNKARGASTAERVEHRATKRTAGQHARLNQRSGNVAK
jgi:hypothetical protein